ncbi:MAG: Hydroxymethylpyrimidine ABC transporter, substrate-binding component, partial [uncultured Thermomicrobiales bacterium]
APRSVAPLPSPLPPPRRRRGRRSGPRRAPCRPSGGRPGGGSGNAGDAGTGLVPEREPRRALPGAGARLVRRRGAGGRRIHPVRPDDRAADGRGRARHLRHLLPDRCPAGPRGWGAGRLGGGAGAAAAAGDHGPRGFGDRAAGRPPRQDGGLPRDPEPGGVPGDDAGDRRAGDGRRRVGQRRLRPRAGRHLRSRRWRLGRLLDPRDDPGRAGGLPGLTAAGRGMGGAALLRAGPRRERADGGGRRRDGAQVPGGGATRLRGGGGRTGGGARCARRGQPGPRPGGRGGGVSARDPGMDGGRGGVRDAGARAVGRLCDLDDRAGVDPDRAGRGGGLPSGPAADGRGGDARGGL